MPKYQHLTYQYILWFDVIVYYNWVVLVEVFHCPSNADGYKCLFCVCKLVCIVITHTITIQLLHSLLLLCLFCRTACCVD